MATRNETIRLSGRSSRAVERLGRVGDIKIRLDRSVDDVTRQIVRAYARAWQVTRGEAQDMATFAATMRHQGAGLTPREVSNLDRVNRSLNAMEQHVRRLSNFTGVTVSGLVNDQVRHDVDTVLDVISEVSGIDRRFTKPSGAAMEGLILRSTGRIEAASRRLSAYQAQALKDSLFRGLIYGDNPRDTAKRIMDLTEGAFLGGASRASTIARTEIMDANRYATRLAYQESEVVTGWKWLAELDTRTCPACWAQHNTRHAKEELLYGHANCRCTQVPILLDDEETDHDLGDPEEIFWGMSREDQLAIMGPGRLRALEAGVSWSDLAYLRHNTDWRPSYQVTRVSDLQGLAELRVATAPGDVITIPGMDNASVMSYAYQQGGLTVHALTGEQPTSGYVVARNGTSEVIEAREFFGPNGPRRMAAWMRRHGDRLDEPTAYVGMWYDTENGKVVLDVVEILDDRQAAIALGRAEDQIAIFDLGSFEEIQTGGTGGYASTSDGLRNALGEADIGRKAIITRGDSEAYAGEVVAAGEWGVRIKTSDGEYVNARPDQVTFVGPGNTTRAEWAREIQRIEAEADHGWDVRYRGAEPRSAREMDDAIDRLAADYPHVEPDWVTTGKLDGAYGLTTTSFVPGSRGTKLDQSYVEIERDNVADYDGWGDSMFAAEQRGHFHGGTSDEPGEYTIDHEFGHVLTHRITEAHPHTLRGTGFRAKVAIDSFNDLLRAEAARDNYTGPLNEARLGNIRQVWSARAFQDAVTRDLSGYAVSNPDELIAEGFAVFRDHGPGKSVVADSVMRNLVTAYIGKYGEPPNLPESQMEHLFPDGLPAGGIDYVRVWADLFQADLQRVSEEWSQ